MSAATPYKSPTGLHHCTHHISYINTTSAGNEDTEKNRMQQLDGKENKLRGPDKSGKEKDHG